MISWRFRRLMRRARLGREYGAASGNVVEGRAREIGRCEVHFGGGGNRLVVGEGVVFRRLTVTFTGHGGTVIIAAGCELKGELRVNAGSTIEIGPRTRCNKAVRIHAGEGRRITIGADCLFADIGIRTSDSHAVRDAETGVRLNPAADVVIEDHVWLSERALVYKGVTIGRDSVVGAGAVVVSSIPAGSVAVGVPARAVRSGVTWTIDLR